MGDLREGYAGSRHGVLFPNLAINAWVLPKIRAVRLCAAAEVSIQVRLEGWEVGMVG